MTTTAVGAAELAAHDITLVPSNADVVNFARDCAEVEVLNLNGAGIIYFTVDGSAPTVAGKHCHLVPAAAGAGKRVNVRGAGLTTVKLISAAAASYSVEGSL